MIAVLPPALRATSKHDTSLRATAAWWGWWLRWRAARDHAGAGRMHEGASLSNQLRVAERFTGEPLREYTAEAFFSIDAANASVAREALEAAVDAIDALLAGRAHATSGEGRSRIQLCMECERDRYAVEEV